MLITRGRKKMADLENLENLEKVQVILLAAGESRRFQKAEETHESARLLFPTIRDAKLWQILHGKPVIQHSIDAFLTWPRTRSLIIVTPPDRRGNNKQGGQDGNDEDGNDEERISSLLSQTNSKQTTCISGGKTRHESFLRGCRKLQPKYNNDAVMVHDAARPLVHNQVLEHFWQTFRNSATPLLTLAKPMSATIATRAGKKNTRDEKNTWLEKIIPREDLLQLETPQAIRLKSLLPFLTAPAGKMKSKYPTPDFSDLISWGLEQGLTAEYLLHFPLNVKITYRQDLLVAEACLKQMHHLK